MERKIEIALINARDDLCFAITEMESNPQYDMRLFGTIVFITSVLGDKYEFKQTMKKRGMYCPDCKHKIHMRKCEIHGE